MVISATSITKNVGHAPPKYFLVARRGLLVAPHLGKNVSMINGASPGEDLLLTICNIRCYRLSDHPALNDYHDYLFIIIMISLPIASLYGQ